MYWFLIVYTFRLDDFKVHQSMARMQWQMHPLIMPELLKYDSREVEDEI